MGDNSSAIADMVRIGTRNKAGRPCAFETEEEFVNMIAEYVKKCDEHNWQPSVKSFCLFADISRETYYKTRDRFPNAAEKAGYIFEELLIHNHGMNVALKIFLLKNNFGYSDKPEESASDKDYIDLIDMDTEEINRRIEKANLQLQESAERSVTEDTKKETNERNTQINQL